MARDQSNGTGLNFQMKKKEEEGLGEREEEEIDGCYRFVFAD